MADFYTYILTNPDRITLYAGMTNDLRKRLIHHYQEHGNPKTFAAGDIIVIVLLIMRYMRRLTRRFNARRLSKNGEVPRRKPSSLQLIHNGVF